MASTWGDEPDWFADSDDDDAPQVPLANGADDRGDDDGVSGSQHCLILVDCSPSHFDDFMEDDRFANEEISPVEHVLRATEELIRSKIRTTVTMRTGQRDTLGLLLYNTKFRKPVVETDDQKEEQEDAPGTRSDEDEEEDFFGDGATTKNVHSFLPLLPPGVETVKSVQEVQDDPFLGRGRDLQADYMMSEEEANEENESQNPLQTALDEALQTYRNCKYVRKPQPGEPSDAQQVWVFTNNDSPCPESAMNLMDTTVSDLREHGIDLIVCPLPKPDGAVFDYSCFYDKVNAQTPLRDLEDDGRPLGQILNAMTLSWKTIRRAYAVPLIMPNWQEHPGRPGIALDVYRMILPGKTPAKIKVHQETGQILARITQLVASGGEVLAESRASSAVNRTTTRTVPASKRLRSYVEFGGEHIPMSPLDKVAIKKAANANSEFASLILLGFRPLNQAPPLIHTLEQSYFAYPSESKTAGSTTSFAALHASMLRKRVVAMGELLSRVSATSRLVAMFALDEEKEEDTAGDGRPPGMMVVPLPFEEEIRATVEDAGTLAWTEGGVELVSDEVVEAAVALIDKQTLDDVKIGENFDNAYLNKYWDYVEKVALGQSAADAKREFDTVLDEKQQALLKELVGKEVGVLSSALPEDLKPEKATKKRKTCADESGVDWESAFLEGAISKCNVAELKAKLKSLGEKQGGRKAELVDRLTPFLQKEFGQTTVKTES